MFSIYSKTILLQLPGYSLGFSQLVKGYWKGTLTQRAIDKRGTSKSMVVKQAGMQQSLIVEWKRKEEISYR